MTTFDEFQNNVNEWSEKNFGKDFPLPIIDRLYKLKTFISVNRPLNNEQVRHIHLELSDVILQLRKSVGYQMLLGMMEELGELAHAHLKGEQGIRHTAEEIEQMKKDSIGDMNVFQANYCKSQGFRLIDCNTIAWDEIKTRNWNENKETGKPQKSE